MKFGVYLIVFLGLIMSYLQIGRAFHSSMRSAASLGRGSVARSLHTKSVDLDTSAGLVDVKVTQRKYAVDAERVKSEIAAIKEALGVSEFNVDVWFCSENKIRELNGENRGKRKSTDVLSFPANDVSRFCQAMGRAVCLKPNLSLLLLC